MHTVNTREMELMEGWFDDDRSVHFRANFVLHRDNGAVDSAAVVIELEPGWALGEHTDSPEEILLVVEGTVEFMVDGQRQLAGPGTVAVVPAMAPHAIRNAGDTLARIIGFFPEPTVTSTFVEPIQPIGQETLVFGELANASAAD